MVAGRADPDPDQSIVRDRAESLLLIPTEISQAINSKGD